MPEWVPFFQLPPEEQERRIQELSRRCDNLPALRPRNREKCSCCGVIHYKEDLVRQMKFVVVNVCKKCVTKMEPPESIYDEQAYQRAGRCGGHSAAEQAEEAAGGHGLEDREGAAERVEAHQS